MSKVVHCRDLGFDCDGVARAETDEAVLEAVAAHARTAHGIDQVSAEMAGKVRNAIRTEAPGT
ncbi:MAG TPA: DUF1059 domain-containing protein [Gemmatimonadales bacterium]|nr:DUF1059 domain-containing protein [Gemmatimonadales bacterium]